LVVLLIRIDIGQIYKNFNEIDLTKALAAVFLLFPLIALKSIRWQVVLYVQGIRYSFVAAFLVYFASMFVGILTPGRLGEFSKAIYISRERGVSSGRAFSGVLADRLFDLYTVFFISMIAIVDLFFSRSGWLFFPFFAIMVIPVIVILSERVYASIRSFASRIGGFVEKFFAVDGWFNEMRDGLLALNWVSLLVSLALTAAAYCMYFFQCQILASSLDLNLTFFQVANVISLAGLVTLLPVSIAGLGTRESVIVSYLGGFGFSADRALSFSLLVFIVFYVGASLIGAMAWLLKPLPLRPSLDRKSAIAKSHTDLELE
jgi:uncharacterized protein (TIRG00374 family)